MGGPCLRTILLNSFRACSISCSVAYAGVLSQRTEAASAQTDSCY